MRLPGGARISRQATPREAERARTGVRHVDRPMQCWSRGTCASTEQRARQQNSVHVNPGVCSAIQERARQHSSVRVNRAACAADRDAGESGQGRAAESTALPPPPPAAGGQRSASRAPPAACASAPPAPHQLPAAFHPPQARARPAATPAAGRGWRGGEAWGRRGRDAKWGRGARES